MTPRPLRPSDIPILKNYQGGLPYPDLTQPIEAVLVLADENDIPVTAIAAEKLIQLYLWMDPSLTPHAKVHALRALHHHMAELLRSKGYTSVEAFLPPGMPKFGRRLERSFGWVKNAWESWSRSF